MIICIQRVSHAAVRVAKAEIARIKTGLLILVGVEKGDREILLDRVVEKVVNLRIFPDGEAKMNRSLLDIGGELLLVSQFTLPGTIRRGRRPSFDHAAPPDEARILFDALVDRFRAYPIHVETGRFQVHMEVDLVNDGPVTLLGQWK